MPVADSDDPMKPVIWNVLLSVILYCHQTIRIVFILYMWYDAPVSNIMIPAMVLVAFASLFPFLFLNYHIYCHNTYRKAYYY